MPLVKKLDDKLKELGYNMEDRFFHQFAELDGEIVKVSWHRSDYRLTRVNIEYIEFDVKDYIQTKEIAKIVADSTTDSYAPKLNLNNKK